jgi:hypothetical protein
MTHRVHKEWQLPISGAHSIMMKKSALAGARPPPFTLVTITYKVAVYAPAEREDTLISTPYMHSMVLPLSATV